MPLSRRDLRYAQAQARRAMEYLKATNVEASIEMLIGAREEFRRSMAGVEDVGAFFRRVGTRLADAFDILARSIPVNWSAIDMADGLDLASSGWPIIWVPRDEIVARLVEAPDDDDRGAILCEYSDEVLDDVEACLNDMRPAESSAILLDALAEAVCAGRQSMWIACQVTTTAVLDTIVGAETDIKYTKAHEDSGLDEEEITVIEMRIALILQSLIVAFKRFFVERGDPIPSTYNRHASVHRLSGLQLTQQNAIFALLLTTSLLRELYEYADGPVTVGERVIRGARP